MKKFKIYNVLNLFLIASIILIGFSSCTNDEGGNATTPPAVASVSKAMSSSTPINPADNDSLTDVGYPSNMYIIKGTGFTGLEKIYFNDKESYFNPTLVTDTAIFVTIDKDTPYVDGSDELKIVTSSGTTIYPFIIGPPAPVLTHGFEPVNVADGGEITIYGNYFLDPIVTIGGTPAEIVSFTITEIVVKLPADSNLKYVTVANISGKVTSTYAIGTAIYDDSPAAYYDLYFPDWNNFAYVTDGTAQQGLTFIKDQIDAWGSLQGNWGWFDKLSPFAGIRFSIKAETAGTVKFCFNGDWSERNMVPVTTEWQTVEIPWSELGNPTQVQNITFQNMTKVGSDGVQNIYSIDNIGFFLKSE